jgi:hypothetical protein
MTQVKNASMPFSDPLNFHFLLLTFPALMLLSLPLLFHSIIIILIVIVIPLKVIEAFEMNELDEMNE